VPPPGLDELRCLVDYDTVGAQLVAALKYRNARRLVPWLAAALAALVPPDTRVITWAPTTDAHRRRRGFDQAAVLARATGRRGGIRVRPLLVRLHCQSQTGRSRLERLNGPRFVARSTDIGGTTVVIDDVVTTGATLAASAEALRRAGAQRVVGVAVAHTRAGRHDPPPISPRFGVLTAGEHG
jgi:predicted amidophosphoribosyltransferase